MPLVKSSAREAISRNISEMENAGHPRQQAIAAALSVARAAKEGGGQISGFPSAVPAIDTEPPPISQKPNGIKGVEGIPGIPSPPEPIGGQKVRVHVGPIRSPVAGRTDHLPMHVPSGAYVIPADIISAMGEGNTEAGFKHMKLIFGGEPYGGKGPYGHSVGEEPYDKAKTPYDGDPAPYGAELPGKASGGVATVPIVAAGGEYVISPAQVTRAGGGDMDTGHKVLDEWVKRMRAKTIKTLQKLPGPRKD